MTRTPPPLPADVEAGLRRLRLAAIRRQAPEVLATAKTQRWAPDEVLFRLIAAAYERRSVAIGSHSPFNDWGRFLPDQPTAVSLLDRLCHHAHIITTTGDSYRLTHRTTRQEA